MFGIKLSREYREMEKLLSIRNEELRSLKRKFKELQTDIATLMEVQMETHRHYGQLISAEAKPPEREKQEVAAQNNGKQSTAPPRLRKSPS